MPSFFLLFLQAVYISKISVAENKILSLLNLGSIWKHKVSLFFFFFLRAWFCAAQIIVLWHFFLFSYMGLWLFWDLLVLFMLISVSKGEGEGTD